MPLIRVNKIKRRSFTALEKKQICLRKQESPKPKNKELALEFQCGETTISDILKESAKWLAINSDSNKTKNKKNRSPKWPTLDEALALWVQNALVANQDLTGSIIKMKAEYFAMRLEINNFKCSNGWIENFNQRHHLKQFVKQGEAASALSAEQLAEERHKLQEILRPYRLEDIWNGDETGLFWKMRPNKTFAQGPVAGTKKEKSRVTVFCACNATGTEMLPTIFINRYKTPRSMRGINYNVLPVSYYWNSTAWMQVYLIFIFIIYYFYFYLIIILFF
jgi:Tc5 transposase DNA-binding domain/DDE superfamily endonuclease/CENP-B N-terminal DNA-binding domain